MRHVGVTRPVRIGKGQRSMVAHQEVLEVADSHADELRRAHGDAIADLTPKDIGYPVTVPTRQTMLAFAPCAVCRGGRKLTVCPACEGAGKVMVLA